MRAQIMSSKPMINKKRRSFCKPASKPEFTILEIPLGLEDWGIMDDFQPNPGIVPAEMLKAKVEKVFLKGVNYLLPSRKPLNLNAFF
jgi:hypothetical protein